MNAIQQITNQLAEAIAQSIAENRIVTVAVECPNDGVSVVGLLQEIEGMEDPDYAKENDGSLDVWGLHDGQEFRIRVAR